MANDGHRKYSLSRDGDQVDGPLLRAADIDAAAEVKDLAPEEFPEGPYGAATNESKLGKTTPWRVGQAFSGRFRDSNPVSRNEGVALEERPFADDKGSIEGQN